MDHALLTAPEAAFAAGLPVDAAERLVDAAASGQLVAIVEPALSPAVAELVAEHLADHPVPPMHATGAPGTPALSPALLAPCPPRLLVALLELGATRPWGVLVVASHDLETITAHWNSVLEVRSPGGGQWSAALHDPRVLADLAPALDAHTRTRVLGPCTLLAADDRAEGEAWVVLEHTPTRGPDASPLVITPALLDAATQGRLRRTRARLARHLADDGFSVTRSNGRLRAEHPAGVAFTLSFHPDGRVHELHDALGVQASFAWPAAGHMRVTRADGAVFVEERDTEGAIVRHGWDGETLRHHHDARGRLVALEEASGETTRMEYDETGALQWRIGPDGTRSGWTRDPETGRVSVVAPGGLRTEVCPEADLDVVMRLLYPDGTREELRAGDDGARTFVLRDGAQVVVAEESDGRTVSWPEGHRTAIREEDGDRRLELEDAGGRIELTLDESGRLVQEREGERVVVASWSALGRRTIAGPDVTTEYRWGSDGRLAAVVIDGHPSIGIRWQPALAARSLMLPGGLELRTRYRPDGRPRSEQLFDEAGRVLEGIEFRYDVRGRLVAQRRGELADAFDFFYDAGGRLVRWTDVSRNTTVHLGYDVHGNLVQAPGHGIRRGPLHEPVGIDGTTIDCDARGRVTRLVLDGASYELGWRGDDRLTSVRGPDGAHDLRYDALGRLRQATDPAGSETFTWFGGELAGWCDASGGRHAFVTLPGELAPRFVVTNGELLVALQDARGAVAGLVPLHRARDGARWEVPPPFGRHRHAGQHPFGLAGQLQLRGVPIAINGGRACVPALGIFLAGDPAALPASAARYAYAMNDPLNRIDPSGLVSAPAVLMLAAVGAMAVGVAPASAMVVAVGAYTVLTALKTSTDALELLERRVLDPMSALFASDGMAGARPSPASASDSNLFERVLLRCAGENRGRDGCCANCTD